MMTASKALIAFCVLAVGGTVLVAGPDGLRRLLPSAPRSDVAGAPRQDAKGESQLAAKPEPGVGTKTVAKIEPNTESTPGSDPVAGAQTASSVPAARSAAAGAAQPTRQVAAALPDLAPPQVPPAASAGGPHFDVARVDPDGVAVIAGQSAPGAKVELLRGNETLDSAVADGAGQFVMTPPKLPPGKYELTLRAKAPDGTVTQSSRGVPVALNEPASAPPRLATASNDVVTVSPKVEASKASKGETAILSANAAAPSAPAAESPTGAITAQEISRLVARGDSLWAISRRIYGDGARYARIFNANRDKIRNPDLIYPGQTFVLPKQ